jgi:hypothetical protein
MEAIALMVGSVAGFVTGFVTWYTLWHRRIEASFERVAVGTRRSAHVLRRGVVLGGGPE